MTCTRAAGRPLLFLLILMVALSPEGKTQRYLSDYDTSFFIRDTVRPVVNRFANILLSGYLQPQYELASAKGINTYAGGNFSEYTNNRFMIRRARIRIDYRMPSKSGTFPAALFTFQVEATERDVNVRDMFVRVYEPEKNNFYLTAGLFARPFGYEVNLSSSVRESPERGRMSQILMPSERDLGAMISYEPHTSSKKPQVKIDAGVFNGQGKSGPTEFDAFKDVISRIYMKPYALSKSVTLGAGLSFLYGGWLELTKYRYEVAETPIGKGFVVDSTESNAGSRAPRQYMGADLQLLKKHRWGKTEIRGEYWRGTQSGTATTTVNPGVLPTAPTYVRQFDGAFFYFIQSLGSANWEALVKYDWYDPNTKVNSGDIVLAGNNLTAADVKFETWGFGLTRYFNEHLKVLAYYDLVHNEGVDVSDNVLTIRMQLKF